MRFCRFSKKRAVFVAVLCLAVLILWPLPAHASVVESVLAVPFNLLATFLAKVIAAYTPDCWIYARLPDKMALGIDVEPSPVFSPEAEIGGVFSVAEWEQVVRPWYSSFQVVAWILMAVTIAFTGLRIASAKDSPRARQEMYEWLRGILIGAAVIAFTPFVVDLLFDINLTIVRALANTTRAGSEGFFQAVDVAGESLLAGAIVKLVWFGEMLWFNIRYLLRKLLIMFLIVMAPLVGWSASWQKSKTSLMLLAGELVSNIFMQSAHAIVLTMILWLWNLGGENNAWLRLQACWLKPAMLALLIPISGIVSGMINTWLELIGLKEEQLTSGAMAKLTGMAGFAGVLLHMFAGPGAAKAGGGLPGGGFSGGPAGSPWTVGGGGASAPPPPGSFAGPAAGPVAAGGVAPAGIAVAAASAPAGAAGVSYGAPGSVVRAGTVHGAAAALPAPAVSLAGASGQAAVRHYPVSGTAGPPAGAAGPVLYGPDGAPLKTAAVPAGAPPAGAVEKPSLAARAKDFAVDRGRVAPGAAVRAAGAALAFATSQRDAVTGRTILDTRPVVQGVTEPVAAAVDRLAGRSPRPEPEATWGFDDVRWSNV